eukprot:CAMPEP_0177669358 /NCGR_PEP_ID=MMETSP0447-20121125/23394_1 /TAXON_ID=0 /ORGANISM="Stygamoeba regulata, Strain BSH-02190019" /LENGTH=240 /DNA_ID=CAMNT_0019176211 /DNA_START=287 /DNA_END=1006 /DNA_ORIENTATION=+
MKSLEPQRGASISEQRLKLSDIVPIAGLLIGRFHRLENELQTALEIWDPSHLNEDQKYKVIVKKRKGAHAKQKVDSLFYSNLEAADHDLMQIFDTFEEGEPSSRPQLSASTGSRDLIGHVAEKDMIQGLRKSSATISGKVTREDDVIPSLREKSLSEKTPVSPREWVSQDESPALGTEARFMAARPQGTARDEGEPAISAARAGPGLRVARNTVSHLPERRHSRSRSAGSHSALMDLIGE